MGRALSILLGADDTNNLPRRAVIDNLVFTVNPVSEPFCGYVNESRWHCFGKEKAIGGYRQNFLFSWQVHSILAV